jgi:HSP20 family protein
MTREQIDLVAAERGLTVRGDRRTERRPGADYDRLERGRGPFSRSFSFPDRIDVDRISADFRDGVLTVRVPKAPRPEARRVPVK